MLTLYPLLTNLYASYQQHQLQESLALPDGADEKPALTGGPSSTPPLIGDFKGALIEIPSINISAAVVRGTSNTELTRGPGWYEESALPGHGNTAIAGHRTMYGAWFRHLDQLQPGDPITLIYEGMTFVYRVEKVFVVASDDWSVIAPCGCPVLTLTTCHPVGSARQRLVVRATLAL